MKLGHSSPVRENVTDSWNWRDVGLKRHLETEGEGLHHVKEILPDEQIPKVIADFAARGMPIIQTGWIDGDVHYYFDSKETLGYIYELGNGGPISPATKSYP